MLKAEDVMRYLQDNPQFFVEYADALAQLVIPHPHGSGAISINERQMLSLRDKNKLLEEKMSELLQFGEENDAISEKVHRLGVALAAANNFQTIWHTLNFHLRNDFAVPKIAVHLSTCPLERRLELPEFVVFDESIWVFADTLQHPYCGPYVPTEGLDTTTWFGDAAAQLNSQALVALRHDGATVGVLALASRDIERFYSGMGTLYLERLGDMISAAMTRTLR